MSKWNLPVLFLNSKSFRSLFRFNINFNFDLHFKDRMGSNQYKSSRWLLMTLNKKTRTQLRCLPQISWRQICPSRWRDSHPQQISGSSPQTVNNHCKSVSDDNESRLFVNIFIIFDESYWISGFLSDLVHVERGEVDVNLQQVVLNAGAC